MSRSMPANRRPDHHRVKLLARHAGASAAIAWQAAPFVDVDYDLAETLVKDQSLQDAKNPWHRFVFALKHADGDFVAVCMTAIEPTDLVPPHQHAKIRELEAWAEMFRAAHGTGNFVYIVVPADRGVICGAYFNHDHTVRVDESESFHVIDACGDFDSRLAILDGLRYGDRIGKHVARCDRHITQVRPAVSNVPRSSRTGKLKPWMRDDLVRIILLDPAEAARKHGMPTGPLDADRRAPVPHGRRGHWRRYRHLDHAVWVRPCWVGPEQWQSNGQVYRVLTAGPGTAPTSRDVAPGVPQAVDSHP